MELPAQKMHCDVTNFVFGKEFCVDFFDVDTNLDKNLNNNNDTESNAKLAAAKNLRRLLSRDLNTEAFYFVSRASNGKNKPIGTSDSSANLSVSHKKHEENDTDSVTSNWLDTDCKSMIGSPLKLQAIANLSMKSFDTSVIANGVCTKYLSFDLQISLKDARKILSRFSKERLYGNCPEQMMVIPCDGEDSNKTLLIGAHREAVDGKNTVKTCVVTSDIVKLSSLRESEKRLPGYQMTGLYKVLDQRDGLGSVMLEVKWSDPYGRVKLANLQAAEFCLKINISSGCDQSPVFNHYSQLQNVHQLIDGLKSGEVPLLSLNSVDTLKQLKELFSSIKHGNSNLPNTHLKSQEKGSTSITGMMSGSTKSLNLGLSAERDFTDQLWDIVSQCTDFSEMVQCLNATFCELRKGDLRVFVSGQNQTTISKLVRQANSGMASFPSLTGCLPLRLVAEIGLEKIRKDYLSIFVNNNLCTAGQWDSFFRSLTSDTEDIMDMEELNIQILSGQLDILRKLHHCLEIITIISLFTENQNLGGIARTVMNHYKSEPLDESHTFSVAITALQASPELKKHPLSSLRRESSTRGRVIIETLMSELPEGLALCCLSSSHSVDLGSSLTQGDSKEFYYFKTEERLLSLGMI